MFYKIILAILKIVFFPLFRIRVHNREKLPNSSDIIVCANHWSNLDPIFLAIALPYEFNFMAKKELFENALFNKILTGLNAFPVDRKSNDLKSLRYSIKLIKEDKTVGIFPEGTRVKSIDRNNMKEGVAFIASKAKADILPVEIVTSYRVFSKVDVYIKDLIEIDQYADLKNKEAMKIISDRVFYEIYDERISLESRDYADNNS